MRLFPERLSQRGALLLQECRPAAAHSRSSDSLNLQVKSSPFPSLPSLPDIATSARSSSRTSSLSGRTWPCASLSPPSLELSSGILLRCRRDEDSPRPRLRTPYHPPSESSSSVPLSLTLIMFRWTPQGLKDFYAQHKAQHAEEKSKQEMKGEEGAQDAQPSSSSSMGGGGMKDANSATPAKSGSLLPCRALCSICCRLADLSSPLRARRRVGSPASILFQ